MSECAKETGGAQPAETERQHHNRLICRRGEQVLFAGAHVESNVRPAITAGVLRDGRPVIHFRNYRTVGRDAWLLTKEGASFTLPEIATAVRRLCSLFPHVPELTAALREMDGETRVE